jgi:hypothetical protein
MLPNTPTTMIIGGKIIWRMIIEIMTADFFKYFFVKIM